jgi:hypothetical protein
MKEKPMTKTCNACGMPMESSEDYALKDTSKDYCRYCCKPDGSMQSYEEKLESFTRYVMKDEGLDEPAARLKAIESMSRLPAWEGR